MLNVRVGTELESRLDMLSKETGRTKTYYVKEALERYMQNAEDIYLAESRLEDIKMGKSKTYTLKQARELLNASTNWQKTVKEINKLGSVAANKIYDYLEELEDIDPRTKWKTLSGKLNHLWRYRVGSYRILAEIQDDKIIVLVVRVGHRLNVYK